MIALLVLVLLLIGLVSVAGYSALAVQQEASQLMKATAENRRLDQWVSLLQSHARAVGPAGTMALPLGEDNVEAGVDYHALPGWISLDRQNSWGKALRYCPFAPVAAAGTTRSIPMGVGESYAVSLTEHAGRAYVTGSAPAPVAGVLGVILSPLPNAPAAACDQVTYSNGSYRVPGRSAMVRTVAVASLATEVEEAPLIVNLTNENISEHTDIISETLAVWSVRQPERTVIRLANSANPYQWPDLTFLSSEPGNTRTIQIIGESHDGVLIDGADGVFRRIQLSGVDLFVENVTLSKRMGMELAHGRIETRNATLGQTWLKDATWRITGPTSVMGASSSDTDNSATLRLEAVTVLQDTQSLSVRGELGAGVIIDHRGGRWNAEAGASLSLYGLGTPTGSWLRDGAAWYLNGLDLVADDGPDNTAKFNALLMIEPGSEARLQGADIDLTTDVETIFNVGGTLSLHASTVDMTRGATRGIGLRDEASLSLSGGTRMGAGAGSTSKPNAGIEGMGGRFVAGTSAAIHAASACWTGALFSSVASQVNGTSAPLNLDHLVFNQSNWTCYSDES